MEPQDIIPRDNDPDLADHYPSDVIISLQEAVADKKNIHIYGDPESGKSTLIEILSEPLRENFPIVFIDESSTRDDVSKVLTTHPPAVIVDGDDTLKLAKGKPSQYQHDFSLWKITTMSQQVISAGARPVIEMDKQSKKYGRASYGMKYDLEVKISKETQPDGTPWFNLEVNDVRYIHTYQVESMKNLLQRISKPHYPITRFPQAG